MRSGRRDDPEAFASASAGLREREEPPPAPRPPAVRPSSRAPLLAAAAVVALVAVGTLHVALAERQWPRRAEAAVQRRLAAVESRASSLVGRLQGEADAVAAWPDTSAALRGDRAALVRIFQALEARTGRDEEGIALALHRLPDGAAVAWSGRTMDPAGLAGLAAGRRDVFVVGGTVTTTLVASSPLPEAGGALGFVTASRAVAIRRNVRNQYLADHDVLASSDPGLDFRYVDARSQQEGPRPFAPPPAGAVFRDAILRAPDGGVLAAVRAIAPPLDQERKQLQTRYRSAAAVLAAVALLLWASAWSGAGSGGVRLIRWAVAAIGARAALLAASPAFPLVSSELLSPDTYASPLLGPLLRSPFDLFLTALAAAVVAFAALRAATAVAPREGRAGRAFAAGLLSLPVIAGGFVLIADTVANSSIDLTIMPLWPRSPAHVLVQVALALVLAAAILASAAIVTLGGPLPARRRTRIVVVLGLAVAAGLAWWAWPHHPLGSPPLPAALVWAGALAVGLGARRIAERLATAEAARITAATLLGFAAIAAVLYPTLVHLGQNALRTQIERSYAPLVLQQPEWRAFVLQAAQARIDGMRLLEEAPPGIYYPGVEELAFAIWSATDLAAYGFSSAVEVQDPSGAVISRFALNLPFLAAPDRRLPASEAWTVSREPVSLASTETMVLHAQRRLTYHGEPHGAVHVYVGEDFSSLPFVQWSNPYSVLYRNAARGGAPERPVNLVVWDAHRDVAFSSLERPPALDPARAADASVAARSHGGLWLRLEVDEVVHHAYLFASDGLVYALAYRRLGPARHVGDLVEAVSGLALLAAALLFVVFLARSLLGRPTVSLGSLRGMVARRFALRLFVAFTLVAFVPAAVLQVVVSGFVTNRLRREAEDQALDRAAVAKKAVEDYAFFQREETPSAAPVTDAALVWLASVVKNDLDVFVRGRLQASSKRELYASGLLAPRVSAAVYRAVVLEGQPAVVGTERIGGFSYLVASVPVHVGGPEHAVLSMPLALRQREVQATVDDLDRTIRLASVLFLALAALLAQSMARRISEPIRDLTRATRRVAEGDLEAQVEARSQDELRALVESFNQMARDLRQQRRDLERSNRLAAWAEMARQVAHEVKNPLTPIQLSAEHLRRVWTDRTADFGATLETCTDTILEQVRTLRGMVTEFSAFARPPAPLLEPQDLRAVLEDAVRPYRVGLPPGVTLALEMEAVPPVRADRRLLERALVNLLENALQAVGDAGRITVRLRKASAADRVEVEVEDSGPGIPPEMRDRIFEPFFSTKTSGSGLGLALVKKIAEDHDGGVTLESAPGQPTLVILWLPVSESPRSG